ncbi:RagB/SusD family nutrient uptake outer membrane protein [Maribacter sp. 2304DJ31-5]|uniref:RagB/SusD family nutrient uptake outer membrane protein n=1 Tax=Maribacter sp. 2304DJ31-5 TaxID=3386273 RepID=UPI0039BC7B1B
MKKIQLIAGILTLMFVVSCEDARDIDPKSSISESLAFKSVRSFQEALNAAYLSYRPEDVIQVSSRISEDIRAGNTLELTDIGVAEEHLLRINPSTPATTAIWTGRYQTINHINAYLALAQSFETNSPTERENLDGVIGQSIALRALAHLDLMALYSAGNAVSDLNVFAPENRAVPIITEIDLFARPTRNTVAEVATFINDELDTADAFIGDATDNRFITASAITAIRARLALYTGQYQDAIDAADELMGSFNLINADNYVAMWDDNDDDQDEFIWSLERTLTAGPNIGTLFNGATTLGASPIYEMAQGFRNIIEGLPSRLFGTIEGGDQRRVLHLRPIEGEITLGENIIAKYPGQPGGGIGRNNAKVFRVAEQYLIKAEAQARLNDFTGAAETISDLRNARTRAVTVAAPDYTNLEEAIRDILLERRIELAYEGHRYIDLRRTRDITGEGIERDSSPIDPTFEDLDPRPNPDCGGIVPCNLSASDARFALPIPLVEISGNPVITQNPGY